MSLQQSTAGTVAGKQVADEQQTSENNPSFAPRLAWCLWIISLILLAIAISLPFATNPEAFAANFLINVMGTPALIAYATIGAVISARRPRNPIGWIFSGTALLVTLGAASEEYARYALIAQPGASPGGLVLAWLSAWTQNLGFFLMFTFLLLLFPDGRLPSKRLRITAWLASLAVVIVAIFDAFKLGPVTPTLGIDNPLGIEFVSEMAVNFGDLIILLTVGVCLLSVIIRYRRAKGDEYHQLKWFAYAAAIGLVQFATRLILPFFITNPDFEPIYDAMLIFSIATFPVAAGIAILKYRLYDIDLLVNRTLVYVPLTAILAGLYSASIALFQKIFVAATGQQSDAAVVITTLILVSSFTPIKNALQAAVDRRFKEAPDPARKLRAFGNEVKSFLQLGNPDLLSLRLLDEATTAFNATGGAIYAGQSEQRRVICRSGGWNEDEEISVSPSDSSKKLELMALGPRRNGLEYSQRDRQALQEIVDVVAGALERMDAGK